MVKAWTRTDPFKRASDDHRTPTAACLVPVGMESMYVLMRKALVLLTRPPPRELSGVRISIETSRGGEVVEPASTPRYAWCRRLPSSPSSLGVEPWPVNLPPLLRSWRRSVS